ncbi:MAG TPA: hypothetical protein VGL56_09840 [Fimbriimonadaceae bacterium]|jgi:hypothetical protein
MPDPGPKNRTLEALKEPANAIGLLVGVAIAAVFPPSIPFVVGALILGEAAYLVAVPRSGWYTKRLSAKFDGDILKNRAKLKQQVFTQLRPEVQARFNHLEEARLAMAKQAPSGEKWFREILRKLDYLLDKFLEFSGKEAEFRKYLRSVLEEALREQSSAGQQAATGFVKSHSQKVKWDMEPPMDPAEVWTQAVIGQVQGHYDDEIKDLNNQRVADTEDLTTNAVLDKRVDIIRRRRDYVGQIGKITVNLNHQLELMEDTFGLISDELRARTPEQILADIDEVIDRTDSLTEMLEGFSPGVVDSPKTVTTSA